MKHLLPILLLCTLLPLPTFPNYTSNTVITVYCKDGPPQVKQLQSLLSDGWSVVNSTPILQTRAEQFNQYSPQVTPVTFTAYIIYILQKEIIESPYAEHHRIEIERNKEDTKYIAVEK